MPLGMRPTILYHVETGRILKVRITTDDISHRTEMCRGVPTHSEEYQPIPRCTEIESEKNS